MGEISVPAARYWGAQTQRSLEHFPIGEDRMPIAVVRAFAVLKKASARVNAALGVLDARKAELISRVADEIASGALDAEFPLRIWQTGSGTHTNMNVNEVIANRAAEIEGMPLGRHAPLHPNDDVNRSQSSNDTFPAALHIAAVRAINAHLLPRVDALHDSFRAKSEAWRDVVKIGRTHLEDAVPLTVGQEWSGYAHQVAGARSRIAASLAELHRLALGGTAVGTGLNAPAGFAGKVAAEIASETGEPFVSAPNKYAELAGADAIVNAMSAVRSLAVALAKIANDIRLLGSGPRCGLGELELPANEPGSSIMPGKVNPSQCEAMIMVCTRVIAADSAVALSASQGNLELNTMRPLIAGEFLHAVEILADACDAFRRFCVDGMELDRARIAEHVERSLMLVTALTPEIGYDRAAKIAHDALARGRTLREAALESGWIDAERFDAIVDARRMIPGFPDSGA